MKEQWSQLTSWWASLAQREKRTVVGGGTVVTLLLFYTLIWSPTLDHVALMRKQIAARQKTLLWMQNADGEIQKNNGQQTTNNQPISPVTLLSSVQKQLEHIGLAQNLTQLKQSGADSVEMHFQKVEFDSLLNLLISIMKSQPVSVTQLSATAQNTPGVVSADVVLKIE